MRCRAKEGRFSSDFVTEGTRIWLVQAVWPGKVSKNVRSFQSTGARTETVINRTCNQDCHRQVVRRERKQRDEESLPGALHNPERLCRQEAAGCGDPASSTEPGSAAHGRNRSALCCRRAGKCQHRDLPLPACDHLDRLKNRAYHTGLQEDERREVRSVTAVPVRSEKLLSIRQSPRAVTA